MKRQLLIGGLTILCLVLVWIILPDPQALGSVPAVDESLDSGSLDLAEPDLSDRTSETPPRVAVNPSVAQGTEDIEILVIDDATTVPVAEVHVVATFESKPVVRVVGVTNSEGLARLDDGPFGELLFVSNLYAIERFPDSLLSSQSVVVRLRRRPVITCLISGFSNEAVAENEFSVRTFNEHSPQLTALRRLLPDCGIDKVWVWPGIGALEITVPTYEPCSVIAVARLPGQAGTRQTAMIHLDSVFPYNKAELQFVPKLEKNRVEQTIDVLFSFPKDVEISVNVNGPLVSNTGPEIWELRRRFGIEGRANVRLIHREQSLVPGFYKWKVTAQGYGTYPMGKFLVDEGAEIIELRNETEFVSGEIVTLPNQDHEDAQIVLKIMNGFEIEAGAVFNQSEYLGSEMLNQYFVPRGEELWARANVHGKEAVTLPVRVDTTRNGVRTLVGDWVESCVVGFDVDGEQPFESLFWLEIRDVVSGMIFSPHARATPRFGPYAFPAGSYSVRVHWVGGASDEETLIQLPSNDEFVMVTK